jgi:hypothetical protein
MAKREILVGSTDQTIDIFVQDSSSTTGAGLAGLAFNTASLVCYYRKGATGAATQLTLVTQTVGGAHSDGGFVEIHATNMKGIYRLDLSDTIVDSAGMVTLELHGAANMVQVVAEIYVTSGDTILTNNDKTGYRLSATGVDDILDEAITEPASIFAWAGASLRTIIGYIGALSRNKMTQTAVETIVRNDADNADIATYATDDDGTIFTSDEAV